MKWQKRLLILFLTGFVLGPIGDYTHVISETTAYPQDRFGYYLLTVPFWVPFLFGTAALLIGMTHPFWDKILGVSRERIGVRNYSIAFLGLLAFLGLYALSGYLPFRTGGLNDMILAGMAILIWFTLDRTWQGIVLGIATAIAGTLTEIYLVRSGAFFYLPRAANFFGVPTWLPWLYFGASVAVGNWGRVLAKPRPESQHGAA